MVNRSQLVFINSKQRLTGQPFEFTMNFNDGLLKADKGCYMRLTVQEATINRSWYSIQSGTNSFSIVDSNNTIVNVTLPIAYYNAIDVRTELARLLPVGWSVTYERKTNKFTFTRPNDAVAWYKFVFTSTLYEILGFRSGEEPTMTIASPAVTSTVPIRVNEENAVVIHTDLPRNKFSAIDNHNANNKSFKESTIMCKIPIQCAPFDNVVYSNQTDTFQFDLTDGNIGSVRVWVTDENDRVLELPYDWSMTWRIEHLPMETGRRDAMLDIRDYIKLMVLSNEKLLSP